MKINTKTKNKIILGIIIAILLMGLGAWFNDFITREKEIKNSPVSYDGQPYIEDSY